MHKIISHARYVYTYVCLFLLLFCSYYTAGRQARFTVTFVYKK